MIQKDGVSAPVFVSADCLLCASFRSVDVLLKRSPDKESTSLKCIRPGKSCWALFCQAVGRPRLCSIATILFQFGLTHDNDRSMEVA